MEIQREGSQLPSTSAKAIGDTKVEADPLDIYVNLPTKPLKSTWPPALLCKYKISFQVLDTLLMLVQEIPKPSTVQQKKTSRGQPLYGRAALDSSAQQARAARHLTELEQDNYHGIQIDIPKSESTYTLLPYFFFLP
jgi:hypothetical protein